MGSIIREKHTYVTIFLSASDLSAESVGVICDSIFHFGRQNRPHNICRVQTRNTREDTNPFQLREDGCLFILKRFAGFYIPLISSFGAAFSDCL